MIRQRVYKNQETGEAMRDVDDALRKLDARFEKFEITDVYNEPMYIGLDAEPWGIFATRIVDTSDPESTLSFDSAVQFVWEGSSLRIRIDAIDGLTVGTKYRYRFLVVN